MTDTLRMPKLAPWILLLGCAGTAMAQSGAVLAPRNADYMRGLIAAGYYDLAEGFAKLVQDSKLPEAEKNAIRALALDLQIGIARRDGDATKRKDLVIQAIKEKEAMIAASPDSADAGILRAELADQYRLLADAYVEAIAQEHDPAKQAALRNEGNDLFVAAEKQLEADKELADQRRVKNKPETDIPFVVAFFNLGRVKYCHSLLFPADAHESSRLLEQALSVLEDFDLEFGDLLVAFEARITAALCYKQAGKMETALGCLDDAIALRKRVEKGADGRFKVDRDAADVISAAVLQKLQFLKEQEDQAKVIATARDFFDTIPDPLQTSQGLAVLAALAEAQMMAGETQAANASAQMLVELDPKGRWGYRGQELLGQLITGGATGGKDLGVEKTIRIAESLAASGDTEQALRICRETLLRAKGADDARFAAEALMVVGAVYASRGWFHEASHAYDSVQRRYSATALASEAVWRAINCYMELNAQEQLPFYKRAIDERSKLLVTSYPDDPHVPDLQLLAAQQLDKAQKYLEAASAYEKIPGDSQVALQARYLASNCYLRQARKFEAGRMDKDAKEFLAKASSGLASLLGEVAAAQKSTTDGKLRARLDAIDFGARTALANIYLQEQKPRAAEAEALLQPIQLKDGDKNAVVVWALRIRAMIGRGAVDDAAAMFDAALQKGGDQRALAQVAGYLARALDQKAIEFQRQSLRTQAGEVWRRAMGYYLRGAERAANNDDVNQIADRLVAIGLSTNGVDAQVESFFEVPDLKIADTTTWDHAVGLYEGLLESGSSNYRIRLAKARSLGFLHRWNEAELDYAKLFADNKLVDARNRIDAKVLTAKPELLTGYLEWGYASRAAAAANDDKARRARASDIFDRVCQSVPQDGKHWWFAKYGQILTLVERGAYDDADLAMRGLERINPDLDGDRFRLKAAFAALKLAIAQKVPKLRQG